MSTTARWTSADLADFPDNGMRYEIIDGELYVSKQPDWEHQYVCMEICLALQTWSKQTGAGVANSAPGVIFADDDDVAPDVVWMSRQRRASIIGADRKLHAAPELMVEVLSPGVANVRRDRVAKLALYSRQHVEEYWIVDWHAQTVDVYRRVQDSLQLVTTLHTGDVITSPLLPGFACPVARLWEPPL